jgi:hypothetical protein
MDKQYQMCTGQRKVGKPTADRIQMLGDLGYRRWLKRFEDIGSENKCAFLHSAPLYLGQNDIFVSKDN